MHAEARKQLLHRNRIKLRVLYGETAQRRRNTVKNLVQLEKHCYLFFTPDEGQHTINIVKQLTISCRTMRSHMRPALVGISCKRSVWVVMVIMMISQLCRTCSFASATNES